MKFLKTYICVTSLCLCSAVAIAGSATDLKSCDSINAAIDSLPPQGGRVMLAAGTYICLKPVVIRKDNVELAGAGQGQTILKAADGKALPVLILGETETAPDNDPDWGWQFYPTHVVSHVKVRDLSVDGNMRAHQNPGAFECYDPVADTSQSCDNDGGKYIRNNGVTIRHVSHALIQNVDTKNNFSGGIVLEKRSDHIVIDGFQTSENFFDGFAGYETTHSTLRHFKLFKNTYSGVSVDMGYQGNTFESGDILDNGDNAVFSAKVGNTYNDVTMEGNKNFGIYSDGRRDDQGVVIPHTCKGNHIYNSHIDSPNQPGIEVNFPCEDFQIANTQINTQKDPTCVYLPDSGAQVSQAGGSCTHLTPQQGRIYPTHSGSRK